MDKEILSSEDEAATSINDLIIKLLEMKDKGLDYVQIVSVSEEYEPEGAWGQIEYKRVGKLIAICIQ